MRQRLPDQRIDGDVVLHVAVGIQDAVLAVGGERIERYVGDDPQFREALTQRAGGVLGNAVRVPGFGGVERLLLQRRHREQRQRRDAQRHQLLGFLEQQVDGQALHAGHRRHRLATVLAIKDEHRQDQVVHRQHVLAYQATGKVVATIAPQASGRKQAIGRNETHGRTPGPQNGRI